MPENKYIKNLINGFMIVPNKENGVKTPIKIAAINIFGPYICNFQASSGLFLDIILPKIWDPSRGATGSILNTARAILIYIKKNKVFSRITLLKKLL